MVNGKSASLSVYPQGVNIVCPANGEGDCPHEFFYLHSS